jgi:hypothetical protein
MFSVISLANRRSHDHLIDWLIIYGFMFRSRIFHLYGDVTIAGEGLQNLGLYARRSAGPLYNCI